MPATVAAVAAGVSGIFGVLGFATYAVMRIVNGGKPSLHLTPELVNALVQHGIAPDAIKGLPPDDLRRYLEQQGRLSSQLIESVVAPEITHKYRSLLWVSMALLAVSLVLGLRLGPGDRSQNPPSATLTPVREAADKSTAQQSGQPAQPNPPRLENADNSVAPSQQPSQQPNQQSSVTGKGDTKRDTTPAERRADPALQLWIVVIRVGNNSDANDMSPATVTVFANDTAGSDSILTARKELSRGEPFSRPVKLRADFGIPKSVSLRVSLTAHGDVGEYTHWSYDYVELRRERDGRRWRCVPSDESRAFKAASSERMVDCVEPSVNAAPPINRPNQNTIELDTAKLVRDSSDIVLGNDGDQRYEANAMHTRTEHHESDGPSVGVWHFSLEQDATYTLSMTYKSPEKRSCSFFANGVQLESRTFVSTGKEKNGHVISGDRRIAEVNSIPARSGNNSLRIRCATRFPHLFSVRLEKVGTRE